VLSQTPPGGLEYFVMDGGSTDDTIGVLKSYVDTDRFSWVSEKDDGQADAVNKGLARARGEIIGWLNSDDIYYPGAIETVCQTFDSDPAIDLVYGEANLIAVDDRVIEPYPTREADLAGMLQECSICQPAVFFRKSVVDRFGALDAKLQLCMDYENWLRLLTIGAKFRRVPQVLAGSRMYPETKTTGSRAKVHTEINNMLRRYAHGVPDRWLFNWAHAMLDAKGFRRSGTGFPFLVAVLSVFAAIRWNRRVSPEMMVTTRQWTGATINNLRARTFS
jgi:glycosyltransferase involved in cell wall biosynthesis